MQNHQDSSRTQGNRVSLLNPCKLQERADAERSPCENCGAALIPQGAGPATRENMGPICIVCGHQNKCHTRMARGGYAQPS